MTNVVRITEILGPHHPTSGMKVAMERTCACGFWESRNIRQISESDGLDLHRAEVLMKELFTDD